MVSRSDPPSSVPYFPIPPQRAEPSGEHSGTASEFSVRDFIIILRKRVPMISGLMVLGLFVGLAICFLTTPQYTATATVMVDKKAGINLGELASSLSGSDSQTELETQVALIESSTTALAVGKRLDLLHIAPFAPQKSFWSSKKSTAPLNSSVLDTNPGVQAVFLATFASTLNVSSKENTRLIMVRVVNPEPVEAARIANTTVEVYLQQYLETRFKATAHASEWVSGQLDALRTNVEQSQQRMAEYAHMHGLSGLMMSLSSGGGGGRESGGGSSEAASSEAQLPEIVKLNLLNTELTEAEAARIQKEAIYHLTQTKSPDVVSGLGSSQLAVSSGSTVVSGESGLSQLNALRLQEAGLQLTYTDAVTKYGKQNPRLISIESQMASLEKQIADELVRINDRAKSDYQLAKGAEDGIRAQYKQQQVVVNQLNNSATTLQVLAAEANASRQLYQSLVNTLQSANVQAGVDASNINLVDIARTPAGTTKPNWRLLPLLASLAGLGLGLGLAFLLESLDDLVRTPEQVENLTPLPVLASLPRDKPPTTGTPGNHAERSLLISRPHDPAAESFRTLRTSIQMSGDVTQLHSLLVTSSLSGEGKSTLSYNLAVAFAQLGRRVILVDADLRKPTQHFNFSQPRAPGLADVLAIGTDWRSTVKPHPVLNNLLLMPAGNATPLPAELLGLPSFDRLLEEVKNDFDLVILDSPPLLLVTDPLILSEKVSGTIAVIRSGVSSRTALRRSLEMLARSRGRVLGMVLNSVDTNSSAYYYSYGYHSKAYYQEEK